MGMTSLTTDGTTKKVKRKRTPRRKVEEQKTKCEAEIEAAVQDMRKKGGFVLRVHAKKGRYHSTHDVVVYKGSFFFPAHGLCNAQAILAEFDILCAGSPRRLPKDIAQEDACFAFAFYLLRDTTYAGSFIPGWSAPRRFSIDKHNMTKEHRDWWSPEAYSYLCKRAQLRTERYIRCSPTQDPTARGIGIQTSVRRRLEALNTRQQTAFRAKLERVEKGLSAQGYKPLGSYGSF